MELHAIQIIITSFLCKAYTILCIIYVKLTLNLFQVQKKLQMRIEAQGKYLQAILSQAQKTLYVNNNSSCNLEANRATVSNFNLALSGFVETEEEKNDSEMEMGLRTGASEGASDGNAKFDPNQTSGILDLNIKGEYELHGGMKGSDLELYINPQRR